MAETAAVAELRRRLREWRADPLRFVRECFGAEPDLWQAEALEALGRPGRKRLAMKACAGPGKTAVLAWAGWHRLACFGERNEHPKGIAVSVTGDNLRRNLWAEMARWRNASAFLQKTFEWTGSRIFARDHAETWFLSATSWPKTADLETIGRTLSGLHSRFPFYLIDESGDIPPNLLRSAEQGLSSCEDGLIITAGNTTSQSGLLYEVAVRLRGDSEQGKWYVISITADPDDPKRTPRVEAEWARQQIETYGRENPWVMAYVLGQFPPGSINALLSVEEIEAAMHREPKAGSYEWAMKRIGVDVARFGDDRTVHFPRQGLAAFQPMIMRHARDSAVSVDIANRTMRMRNELEAEEAFFDDTVGWAHGAVDVMRAAGRPVYAVQFDKPSANPRYFNMRAQMHLELADWVKGGGCLPRIPELVAEATAATYFFSGGKFQIESKDQVKKRLGRSPDLWDALALTFALPDTPKALHAADLRRKQQQRAVAEYDPYARM
jgi:phage terminase large subunit